jgi:pyruvate/2-oxoglutarate dehydrogenase complex dihydrolipoamide dehydrogenase (E3) component
VLREASKAYMPVGKEVVIVGGGLVGLELAEFLAERGRQVTILEEGPKFGLEMAHPRRWRVLDDLRHLGVELIADARIHAIGKRAIETESPTAEGGRAPRSIPADTVILAVGLAPNPGEARALAEAGVPLREIGDVTGVGYLEGAIRDGFHAALDLG